MLLNKKIIDVINKEIKTQDSLVKLLENQEINYGVDNSLVIKNTKDSITYMNECVKNCKKN